MRKQSVIEAGEDWIIREKKLPESGASLMDYKLARGWYFFRDFLHGYGKKRVLVTTERDAMPQSPYIEDIKPYTSTIDDGQMAWDAEAREVTQNSRKDANYLVASTLRIVVLALLFIVVVMALLVAAGRVDFQGMIENWTGAFQ